MPNTAAPQTDANVPAGHVGLHTALYGTGGAEEAHGSSTASYRIRQGQDDGSTLVPVEEWLAERDGEKPLGIYALYNANKEVQYVGYHRNMVLAVRSHAARVPSGRAAFVRAKLFTDKAMATRDHLERQVTAWMESELGPGMVPPGNGPEKGLWEGAHEAAAAARVLSQAEAEEHADKATKLRRAMGEVLAAEAAPATASDEQQQRRLNTIKAMEGGDWSEVIAKQTAEAVGAPAPPPQAPSNSGQAAQAAPAQATQAAQAGAARSEPPVASPFTQATVHRAIGGDGAAAAPRALTLEAADQALNEVRPYLIDDGGDVEVVGVENGVVSLRLQGACSSCASSGSTMKMGIERALQAAFGDELKGVVQVDKIDVISATKANVDMHLNMLRGAITGLGGSVEVMDVANGAAVLKYKGPDAIRKGVSAAIKDQFPEIKDVQFV